MNNNLRQLVKDTLAFVKEEARTKKSLLVSKEQYAFFKQTPTIQKEVVKEEPALNFSTPTPVIKETPKAPSVEVKEVKPKPPVKNPPLPMDEWRKTLARSFPNLAYVEKPPHDAQAKEIAERWKKHVIPASALILSFNEKEEELLLLKNLAKAIHTQLKPTKILDALSLEKEKKWDLIFQLNTFELIVVEESAFFKLPELKQFFQPATSVSGPLLASTPLILLNAEVLKDKAALWKKICHLLRT